MAHPDREMTEVAPRGQAQIPSSTLNLKGPSDASKDDTPRDSLTDRPESSQASSTPEPKPTSPGPTFPPLRKTTTVLSTTTPAEAAEILANFAANPAHPRNWTKSRKWHVTLTVAVTGFISTCGSSIAVPAIHQVMDEFGVDNEKVGVLITTFYVLGLGAGPFIFAPISELYGRQPAYLLSQVLYFLFCIGTATCDNMTSLIVLRFFCGVFGSSGPALGVATCGDMWQPSERGRPISIYAVGPMAGPVLGSMMGYWILFGGWRWLMWTITILSGLNVLLFIFIASETNADVIEKKLKYRATHPTAARFAKSSPYNPVTFIHGLGWMSAMVSADDAKVVFGRAFSRPPRLLFGNPVCAMFAAYYAYIYAIIYIFLVTVPLTFGSPPFNRPGLFSYQWPQSTLSLAYLGLAFGAWLAATIAATAQDRIYKHLTHKNGGKGQPEYRLILTQAGMCIMPMGLIIFAWTAQTEVHWMGPQVGFALVLLGLTLAFNSIQNFIVDAFFPYSAAGVAAITVARSVLAGILPIFAPDMFHALGWGWGGTLLALVAAIAIPAPLIMFKYGKALREKYQFDG